MPRDCCTAYYTGDEHDVFHLKTVKRQYSAKEVLDDQRDGLCNRPPTFVGVAPLASGRDPIRTR